MPDISFTGLVIVAVVAFVAALALGLFPKLRLPAVVLEIVLGIVIGPSVLNWVQPDLAIRVLALLGLAFLLVLAGLEVDLERLRGRLLRLAGSGFGASVVLALAIGAALQATGQGRSAGFVAIVLLATSLGVVVAVLKDAGVVRRLIDRDAMMGHPRFRAKLEGIGYGFLIPVFLVNSGITFSGGALFCSPSAILRVRLFLAALVVVRGLPALAYRRVATPRRVVAAGLLQATSLPFIVAATQIGMDIGTISQPTGAAFVAAGLLSVLVFPLVAVTLLKGTEVTAGEPA